MKFSTGYIDFWCRPAIPKVRYSERLLPTVTLRFRQFGLRIANVGKADLRNSGPNPDFSPQSRQTAWFLQRARCNMLLCYRPIDLTINDQDIGEVSISQ
jgi:hypothetical protein